MILTINDWIFDIDMEKTREHASFAVSDHCTCGYCANYYRAVRQTYPKLSTFVKQFGADLDGPVEMYPIEPTLYLAGYRIFGKIQQAGAEPFMEDGIPITAVPTNQDFFMLEVGEMALPWLMSENPDEVISPANEPEFLDKMYRKVMLRNGGTGFILS